MQGIGIRFALAGQDLDRSVRPGRTWPGMQPDIRGWGCVSSNPITAAYSPGWMFFMRPASLQNLDNRRRGIRTHLQCALLADAIMIYSIWPRIAAECKDDNGHLHDRVLTGVEATAQ